MTIEFNNEHISFDINKFHLDQKAETPNTEDFFANILSKIDFKSSRVDADLTAGAPTELSDHTWVKEKSDDLNLSNLAETLKFIKNKTAPSIGHLDTSFHKSLMPDIEDDSSDDDTALSNNEIDSNHTLEAEDLPKDEYDVLADRANIGGQSNVTADDMREALAYLENNAEQIERLLAEKNDAGEEFVLLRKEDTGLNHNLEYHDKNEVFLRYHSDFASGTQKMASKVVDLHGKELLVKSKMIVVLGNDSKETTLAKAQTYHEVRALFLNNAVPRTYTSSPTTSSDAHREFVMGKGVEGVLQNRKITYYDKEQVLSDGTVGKVTKVAIYSILQEGSVNFSRFQNLEEQSQAANSMVKNTANLNRAGIAHNDLKGPNFLFSRGNDGIETKITDLGLSNPLNKSTNYHLASRNSPEVLMNRKNNDISSLPSSEIEKLNKAKDAWALGESLLKDAFGFKTPWETVTTDQPDEIVQVAIDLMNNPNTIADLVNQIDDSEIPSEFRHIITRLLDPNPQTRMTAEEAEAFLAQNGEITQV